MHADEYSCLEHLKLVQGVISRMGQNSFALKGWSVTLVAALMALAVNTHRRSYALLALFPSAIFWALDAYYLWQERRFRAVYDEVCAGTRKTYSLAPPHLSRRKRLRGWLGTLFRPTVLYLHLAIAVVIVAIIITLSRR
ncbi:MAG: hypothetical protein ACREK6_00035 [Candidatus Rokuibacteriota bacterium]